MTRIVREVSLVAAAVVFAAGAAVPGRGARAAEEKEEEGGLTRETRAKLARRVTIEEGHLPLAELAERMAEQAGLSFTSSALVARLPEPVAVVARDVPAGELIDSVAWAMDLEYVISPGGIVTFRLGRDDPRREVLLERVYRPHEERGPRAKGGPPAIPPREAVERALGNFKVQALLEQHDAELFPDRFIPEKRIWVLAVRRGGEGKPVARVYVNEHGEVVGIDTHQKKPKPKKEGDGFPKKKGEKGFDRGFDAPFKEKPRKGEDKFPKDFHGEKPRPDEEPRF